MSWNEEIERAVSLREEIRDKQNELNAITRDSNFLHKLLEYMPYAISVNWRIVENEVQGHKVRK